MNVLKYISHYSKNTFDVIKLNDDVDQKRLYDSLVKRYPTLTTDQLDYDYGVDRILINKDYLDIENSLTVGYYGDFGDGICINSFCQNYIESVATLQKTFVLFNGAPNSGKDTAADLMCDVIFGEGVHLNFKDALYKETAKFFNVPLPIAVDLFKSRELKEVQTKEFTLGLDLPKASWVKRMFLWLRGYKPKYLSPRQALIHVSESVIKPLYGDDFFGQEMLKAAESFLETEFVFAGDSGFLSELEPLVEAGHKVVVIQMHREGCTFKGDSRNYIEQDDVEHLGIKVIKLDNNESLEQLKSNLLSAATQILGGQYESL